MTEEKNFEFPILSIDKEEYTAIQNWIEDYREYIFGKKLYIFGAGIRGNMILKLLEEAHVKVAGFCDNSIEKQGAHIKEYKIFSPSEICANLKENYILISPENSEEIERMVEEKGFIRNKNYFVIKNHIYQSYQNEFFREEKIEYILFGDCYFTDLDVDDLQDKSMGELSIEKLGIEKTKLLSLHGMCIPGFYHLMQLQIKLGIIPKAVAFIVNVPFCNGIQTKLPQSQHAALLKQIREGLPIQCEDFEEYIKLAEARSHNINAKSFSTKGKRRGKDDNYVEKLLTKTRYMYDFREDNENIVYLNKMIELCLENQIKPVPFIPAINYDTGLKYYGQEFKNKYSAICDGIKGCTKKYGVEVLDMSYLLEKTYFTGDRMTKFPNSKGKEKEISLLCKELQSL